MNRDIQRLARRHYDVVVVGGGIYGAALVREAALCGLDAALVEKGDFASATSSKTLKIIHGGLRYLRQFDAPRVRTSVRERGALLTIAPHLVHPLPCIMPTQGHGMNGRAAMFCGLLVNDILSFDRNRMSDPEKRIPRGKLISRDEVCRRVPGLSPSGITGGGLWHDASTYNSERLVIAMLRDAVQAGADVANYLKMIGCHQSGKRFTGLRVRDELDGSEYDISARLLINATGPWVNEVLSLLNPSPGPVVTGFALGMNFVLNRDLLPGSAAGLPFRRASGAAPRRIFLKPWRGRTLAGTYYRLHNGNADSMRVTDADISALLSDLNQAHPAAEFRRTDIACILGGLLPVRHNRLIHDEPVLANRFSIIDHAERDGIEGLMTVVGVKYTTARDVASRTLTRVLAKLGRTPRQSGSDQRILPGGHLPDFGFALQTLKANRRIPGAVSERLLYNYGSEIDAVLDQAGNDPALLAPLDPATPVIGAEILHAIRHEMAVTLSDAVFRRTDLGSAGQPSRVALEACARLMATECGWNESRLAAEVRQVLASPLYLHA